MGFRCLVDLSSHEKEFLDDGGGRYKGECVSLVKRVCSPSMPPTKQWRRGALVKGNTSIAAGTAIATFLPTGEFKSGDGHAAIFIGQDDKGIYVWDQYNDPPKGVSKRFLAFKGGKDGSTEGNDGSNFYVIEVAP